MGVAGHDLADGQGWFRVDANPRDRVARLFDAIARVIKPGNLVGRFRRGFGLVADGGCKRDAAQKLGVGAGVQFAHRGIQQFFAYAFVSLGLAAEVSRGPQPVADGLRGLALLVQQVAHQIALRLNGNDPVIRRIAGVAHVQVPGILREFVIIEGSWQVLLVRRDALAIHGNNDRRAVKFRPASEGRQQHPYRLVVKQGGSRCVLDRDEVKLILQRAVWDRMVLWPRLSAARRRVGDP